MKIDMFADDGYKEQYGHNPQKRLYRGTQASVYPAKDVDILDATIKGVARGEPGLLKRQRSHKATELLSSFADTRDWKKTNLLVEQYNLKS